jgi:hypothetical protein
MRRFFLILLALGLLIPRSAGARSGAAPWGKISPELARTLAEDGIAPALIVLPQADLSGVEGIAGKAERGEWVYRRLLEHASRTQRPLLAYLDSHGIPYRSFFVVNAVAVDLTEPMARELAMRPDVVRLVADAPWRGVEEPRKDNRLASVTLPWGLTAIGADRVWSEYGIHGEGVVVATNDTGVDWTHPVLKPHYRGWNGAAATHDYNWHDSIEHRSTPFDGHGHGTHVTGIMVGADGSGTVVGVAYGAEWIGCRNMNASGVGSPSGYIECYQWFLAPTDVSGRNPRPDLAPDVVNNSWTCPSSEGCTEDKLSVLRPAMDALLAAGIFQANAAGNSGSACGSILSPPSLYPEGFDVGAYNSSHKLASFSSRGPITFDGREYVKPDLTAPGVGVYSSLPGGTFASWSGTSMATPHVAGAVALLWSAMPSMRGNIPLTVRVLEETATHRFSDRCGGAPGNLPNNEWGWGELDAYAAVTAALSNGIVHGDVRSTSGQPLPGALLTFSDAWAHRIFTDTTDLSGVFSTTLPTGTYDIAVSRTGYHGDSKSNVLVIGGDEEEVDFTLTLFPEGMPYHLRLSPVYVGAR